MSCFVSELNRCWVDKWGRCCNNSDATVSEKEVNEEIGNFLVTLLGCSLAILVPIRSFFEGYLETLQKEDADDYLESIRNLFCVEFEDFEPEIEIQVPDSTPEKATGYGERTLKYFWNKCCVPVGEFFKKETTPCPRSLEMGLKDVLRVIFPEINLVSGNSGSESVNPTPNSICPCHGETINQQNEEESKNETQATQTVKMMISYFESKMRICSEKLMEEIHGPSHSPNPATTSNDQVPENNAPEESDSDHGFCIIGNNMEMN